VAHPDDETIFFGGLVMTLAQRSWRIIVVTDGNADGEGEKRSQQFAAACTQLGVKNFEMWNFPDRFEDRLDVKLLVNRLSAEPMPRVVFTHGIIGEYGHPHHQDVSWAVHQAFYKKVPIWSAAYNSFATKSLRLTKQIFRRKAKILSEIYFSETFRFARMLPFQTAEGFHRLDWSEVASIYNYLSQKDATQDDLKLKTYSLFRPYLVEQKKASQVRPF
jgi:LmbE family N-acetylglucosaminyl deacetylase